MRRGKSIPVAFSALMVAACSGRVVMSPLGPATMQANYAKQIDTDGIIVYRAIPVVEVDKFIQISVPQDPTKPGGPSVLSGACKEIEVRKVTSIADFQHPYRLHYEHGFLEAYTFSANLSSDGILTAINTVSTPDQGKTLQNLTSAASTAAAIPKEALGPVNPPCTVTPVFVRYENPPALPTIETPTGQTSP